MMITYGGTTAWCDSAQHAWRKVTTSTYCGVAAEVLSSRRESRPQVSRVDIVQEICGSQSCGPCSCN